MLTLRWQEALEAELVVTLQHAHGHFAPALGLHRVPASGDEEGVGLSGVIVPLLRLQDLLMLERARRA